MRRARCSKCVQALEAGDFDRADALMPGAGATYLDALVWANEAANPLLGDGTAAATDSVAA